MAGSATAATPPFCWPKSVPWWRLPDELSYLDGAMVACGLGTAYAAILRAAVSGRDTVLVTGLGPVGLAAAMLAQAMGARVIGTDIMPERRMLAEQLGVADLVIASDADDLKERLLAATGGHGFEVGIDCSGNADARRLCLEMAREWGRVAYVGEGGTVTFAPSPLLIHKQLTLHGSWVCSVPQMIESGRAFGALEAASRPPGDPSLQSGPGEGSVCARSTKARRAKSPLCGHSDAGAMAAARKGMTDAG